VENNKINAINIQTSRLTLIFQEMVKVIKAECLINNKPSARIIEKAGLKEVNRDDELVYFEYIKSV